MLKLIVGDTDVEGVIPRALGSAQQHHLPHHNIMLTKFFIYITEADI
jgi:hypothetical protein